jgi:hypothetical protein
LPEEARPNAHYTNATVAVSKKARYVVFLRENSAGRPEEFLRPTH